MSLTPEKTLLVMESGETEIRTPESLDMDSSWFRKSSTVSFLEPALGLARRLSVRFHGQRGQSRINRFDQNICR